jgi:hypothetical protein
MLFSYMQCASALVSKQICTNSLYFSKYAASNLLVWISLLISCCHGTGRRKTLKLSTSAKCCICVLAMSADGQPYWLSNSLGAQLPYGISC